MYACRTCQVLLTCLLSLSFQMRDDRSKKVNEIYDKEVKQVEEGIEMNRGWA